jgi:DNA mismatch endonuclease (patch repair protein)
MNGLWNDARPDDQAWRAPKELTRSDRAREQDQAAGGRDRRLVRCPDGTSAMASVCLRLFPKGRRVYAYLRWFEDGRTIERYLGEVTEADRPANLAAAWRTAARRQITQTRPSTPPV